MRFNRCEQGGYEILEARANSEKGPKTSLKGLLTSIFVHVIYKKWPYILHLLYKNFIR